MNNGNLVNNNTKITEKNEVISTKKGMDSFIKRQIQARQTKKEKEQLLAQGNTQHRVILNAKSEKNEKMNEKNEKNNAKTDKIEDSSAKKTKITQPKEFNFNSNRQTNSEKKSEKKEEILRKNEEIYISDVSYGDALNFLHAELHKLKL